MVRRSRSRFGRLPETLPDAAVLCDLAGAFGFVGAAARVVRALAGRAGVLALATLFARPAVLLLADFFFLVADFFLLAGFARRPFREAGRRVVFAARLAVFRDAFAFAFFAMSKPLRACAQVRTVLSVSEGSLP
jgi:hypothetical protein